MINQNILKLGALEAEKTAFFLCDIQDFFEPNVKHFGEVVEVANKMITAAKHFQIPVYISEHYPKDFGHTVKDINTDDAALVYEKTTFSMYNPELKAKLAKDVPGLSSVVLFGVEEDIVVHLLADGVSSRSLMDRELALQRLQSIGCFVSTAENVLFKLLKDSFHPAFKTISNMYPTPDKFGASKLSSDKL